jgi:hypothetical protein
MNKMATAMHVNNKEVAIPGPLEEPDQTSAFNMENIYSSEATLFIWATSSPKKAVHLGDIEVGISKPLEESNQTLAFNMKEINSSESNSEYVIGINKRIQAKNEHIRLAKQGSSDNSTHQAFSLHSRGLMVGSALY